MHTPSVIAALVMIMAGAPQDPTTVRIFDAVLQRVQKMVPERQLVLSERRITRPVVDHSPRQPVRSHPRPLIRRVVEQGRVVRSCPAQATHAFGDCAATEEISVVSLGDPVISSGGDTAEVDVELWSLNESGRNERARRFNARYVFELRLESGRWTVSEVRIAQSS